MKMNHIRFSLALGWALGICSVAAANSEGAAFLLINPSARLSAMGAGRAVARDSTSLFSNPAGAAFLKNNQLLASYSNGSFDNPTHALGFVYPFSLVENEMKLALGVSAFQLEEKGIDGRDSDRGPTGSYETNHRYVGLSLATRIGMGVSLGATIKAVEEQIGGFSGRTVLFDVGSSFQTLSNRLTVAGSINNIGGQMKLSNERYSVPSSAGVGLGLHLGNVVLAAEAESRLKGGRTKLSVGGEFVPVSTLALRLGALDLTQSRSGNGIGSSKESSLGVLGSLGAGVGLRMGRYQVDYGFVPNAALKDAHRLNLTFDF